MNSDDYADTLWPQKGEKLFKETGEYFETAHFGWGKLEDQLFGYREGYKQAADVLIEYALNSDDRKTLDTFIFPICFLYRQYIELILKDIFLKYSNKTKCEKRDIIADCSHDLKKIWNQIKPILCEGRNEEEINDVNVIEDYIKQFYNIDRSSFSFRYPINKKNLGLIFDDFKYINLTNLKKRMDELYNFLDACDLQLSEERDIKNEMYQEFLTDDFDI